MPIKKEHRNQHPKESLKAILEETSEDVLGFTITLSEPDERRTYTVSRQGAEEQVAKDTALGYQNFIELTENFWQRLLPTNGWFALGLLLGAIGMGFAVKYGYRFPL